MSIGYGWGKYAGQLIEYLKSVGYAPPIMRGEHLYLFKNNYSGTIDFDEQMFRVTIHYLRRDQDSSVTSIDLGMASSGYKEWRKTLTYANQLVKDHQREWLP